MKLVKGHYVIDIGVVKNFSDVGRYFDINGMLWKEDQSLEPKIWKAIRVVNKTVIYFRRMVEILSHSF